MHMWSVLRAHPSSAYTPILEKQLIRIILKGAWNSRLAGRHRKLFHTCEIIRQPVNTDADVSSGAGVDRGEEPQGVMLDTFLICVVFLCQHIFDASRAKSEWEIISSKK